MTVSPPTDPVTKDALAADAAKNTSAPAAIFDKRFTFLLQGFNWFYNHCQKGEIGLMQTKPDHVKTNFFALSRLIDQG
jgi:hypothetical protein